MNVPAYGRVYLITNLVTGKLYVGQTMKSVAQRWRAHVHATGNKRRLQPITAAIRKYGPDAFVIEELEVCADRATLNDAELRWATNLDTFAPVGYNLRAGEGTGSVSDVSRQKLRALMTDERREALRQLWRGRRLPDAAYVNARAAQAARRRTWHLIDPSGSNTVIPDPGQLCRDLGLELGNLRAVAWGIRPAHRGWRLLPQPPPVTLGRRDGHLVCPTCGDLFPTQMRCAANTHANACAFRPQAMAAAIRLGHCTADESATAVSKAEQRLGRQRCTPDARKRFVVIDPAGSPVSGVGIRDFAAQHGLNPGKLSNVVNGKQRSHRGWTVQYGGLAGFERAQRGQG